MFSGSVWSDYSRDRVKDILNLELNERVWVRDSGGVSIICCLETSFLVGQKV